MVNKSTQPDVKIFDNLFRKMMTVPTMTLLIVVVICNVLTAVHGYPYTTMPDTVLVAVPSIPQTGTNITSLTECENNCRLEPMCQTFEYELYSGQCNLHAYTLKYGSLWADKYNYVITGQLESKATDAPLAWLGIGAISKRDLNTGLSYFEISRGAGLKSGAECQAYCDAVNATVRGECVAYELKSKGQSFCAAYNAIVGPSDGTLDTGVRADISTSDTEIFGDPFETRVKASDFPADAPDIGAAIPPYVEVGYHYISGLSFWTPMYPGDTMTESWQQCSVLCHQRVNCLSFHWMVKTCHLYDVAILGHVTPGYAKYGVIDRSEPEGSVTSLVDAVDVRLAFNGYALVKIKHVLTMDACAKHCYEFNQPKRCVAFFVDSFIPECTLYADSIPYAPLGFASYFINLVFPWDPSQIRFGYLGDRVPQEVRLAMIARGMTNITMIPTAVTTATTPAETTTSTSSLTTTTTTTPPLTTTTTPPLTATNTTTPAETTTTTPSLTTTTTTTAVETTTSIPIITKTTTTPPLTTTTTIEPVTLTNTVESSSAKQDYQSCVQEGGYQWQRMCFRPKLGATKYLADGQQKCIDDGGSLASLISADVRKEMAQQMAALLPMNPEAKAWLAIKQKAGQTKPTDGWYYFSAEETVDAVGALAIDWAKNEPNDFDHPVDLLGETGGEDVAHLDGDGTIHDMVEGVLDVHFAICKYKKGGRHVYGKPLHGYKMLEPTLATLMGVATVNRCAKSCYRTEFCRSFSYSASEKMCHHHCFPPGTQNTTVVIDAAYSVYESMSVD